MFGVKYTSGQCSLEFTNTWNILIFSIASNLVFAKMHSTIDALAELTERIRVSQFKVVNFFLDLQKEFDTLDHQILLCRLESYGIRHKRLEWFKSYLSNRTQRVFVAGVTSTLLNKTCGVHQGSILGPLLFLILYKRFTKSV